MSNDNLKKKTVRGLFTMSFSSGAVFVIQFITTIILARIFLPEEFGIISAVTIITSFTDLFWMAGVGPALVQKKNIKQDDIITAYSTSIGLGLIAFLIIVVLSPILIKLINIEEQLVLIAISFSFIINSFGVVPLSLLQREMRFSKILYKDLFSIIGYSLVAIILGISNFGVWGLVIALLVKYIISTIIVYYSCKTKLKLGFNLNAFKELIKFGGGFTLSKFFNVMANQGDYFIVTQTLGAYFLGIYNRTYQLIAVPANLVGTVIDMVFFPAMSKIQTKNEKLSDIFTFSTTIMAFVYFPLGILIYLYSEEIVTILLGEKWIEAAVPIKILSLSLFFRVGYKIIDPIFRAKGAVYNRAFLQFIYALMVLSFAYFGSKWGLLGISVGVAIALIINYIMLIFALYKLIRFNIIEFLRCSIPIMLMSMSILSLIEKLESQITYKANVISSVTISFVSVGLIISLSYWILPQKIRILVNRLVLSCLSKVRNFRILYKIRREIKNEN